MRAKPIVNQRGERECVRVREQMQRLLRAVLITRRCSDEKSREVIQCIRRLSSSTQNQHVINEDLNNQVLVESKASSRMAILNRPANLNAINTNMAAKLIKLYESWEDDPYVGFVTMKGSGRAFCAGGDIVAVYNLMKQGKLEQCKEFFRTAYSFMYLVGTYLKPHVAILNGITMGGGAGVSMPGTFRLATSKTVFADPETLIGFHPDAGASFYLSHLPGHLGEYLALTGEKLYGAELAACGLATHFVLSERHPLVEEQLGLLVTDDPSEVEAFLQNYSDPVEPPETSVLHRMECIDKCFSLDSVEEIIDCLDSEAARTDDRWYMHTSKILKEAPPLSLKVSLKSIREGRFQTYDQCLIREYRMTLQALTQHISGDFYEGIRARMVDKDLNLKWNPSSLEQVSNDMVDQYFSRLSESEPDLDLPTKQREAFI